MQVGFFLKNRHCHEITKWQYVFLTCVWQGYIVYQTLEIHTDKHPTVICIILSVVNLYQLPIIPVGLTHHTSPPPQSLWPFLSRPSNVLPIGNQFYPNKVRVNQESRKYITLSYMLTATPTQWWVGFTWMGIKIHLGTLLSRTLTFHVHVDTASNTNLTLHRSFRFFVGSCPSHPSHNFGMKTC